MTHLIIDVDSKIPNLALMKTSQFIKDWDSQVQLHCMRAKPTLLPTGDFDGVSISCVFEWNRPLARMVEQFYTTLGIQTYIGGTGISKGNKLRGVIEDLPPDYDLYGDDRAVGFVQRGCIRKCEFCYVPEKEGRLMDNPYRPIETWVPKGFSKVLLLDNEFAAMSPDVYPEVGRDIEGEVIATAKNNGWKISITQGYDIRFVNKRKAEQLAGWKPMDIKFREPRLYFSWDYFWIEPYVRRGIETLLDAGFKGRELMCYCLVGFNPQRGGTSHKQDYHRFKVLWEEYGVLPFIMRYNMRKDDRFLNAFSRYVNRGPRTYRHHSFEDYCGEFAPDLLPEVRLLAS